MHKYQQVAAAIREKILSGTYPNIPGEDALAREYAVSRSTIRQALEVLKDEGLIQKQQGKATKIAQNTYRKPRFYRVGMISWDMDNYIFSRIIQSVEEVLRKEGFALELRCLVSGHENKRFALEHMLRADIDGLIMEGLLTELPTPNIDLHKALLAQGIPIVQTNAAHRELQTPSVTTDDTRAIVELMDHLVSLGHKKIGAIFNPLEAQSIARYNGYVEGLRRNNLRYCDSRVLFLSLNEFMYLFDSLFYAHQETLLDCTAIVCTNDIVARFIETTLLRAGIKVPGDMSITGLDGAYEHVPQQLDMTTAVYPAEAVGEAAAEMILAMMRTGFDVESRKFPMPLKIGQTTAPASLRGRASKGLPELFQVRSNTI